MYLNFFDDYSYNKKMFNLIRYANMHPYDKYTTYLLNK